MSIAGRVGSLYNTLVFSQSPVGGNFTDSYNVASTEFARALQMLRTLAADVSALENGLDLKGAPWTPGRIPEWSPE